MLVSKSLIKYFFFRLDNKLRFGILSKGGRNFFGRIVVFHKGGGNRRKYRLIDFYRKLGLFGIVFRIIWDSCRSAYLGLILYTNGYFSYIILSDGVSLGDRLYSGNYKFPNPFVVERFFYGWSFSLQDLGLFWIVNSICFFCSGFMKLARSAGAGALIVSVYRKSDVVLVCCLKLSSGWHLHVDARCSSVIGYVSNADHNLKKVLKAGKSRNLGWRPVVRGVAMNPFDHPHGGGNGKKSPPAGQVSPWGKLTKGRPSKRKKIDFLKRRIFRKLK